MEAKVDMVDMVATEDMDIQVLKVITQAIMDTPEGTDIPNNS